MTARRWHEPSRFFHQSNVDLYGAGFAVGVAFTLDRETEFNRDGTVHCERNPDNLGGTTEYGIDAGSHPGETDGDDRHARSHRRPELHAARKHRLPRPSHRAEFILFGETEIDPGRYKPLCGQLCHGPDEPINDRRPAVIDGVQLFVRRMA